MAPTTVPAVFRFLGDTPNVAADTALEAALPDMEPEAQREALGLLVRRNHLPTLASLVGRFEEYAGPLQVMMIERAGDLLAGMRLAVVSPVFEHRRSTIALIERGRCASAVYLLADALRRECRSTQELATVALGRMTSNLLECLDAGPDIDQRRELNALGDRLGEALSQAIWTWELHCQAPALEAALRLTGRTIGAIRRKLQQRHTEIHRAINGLVERARDPRLAGFTLRALAIPRLQSAAGRAIGEATDGVFQRAVVQNSWLLIDEEVRLGCRCIKTSCWLHEAADQILKLDDHEIAAALRLVSATGGTQEGKIRLYRDFIGVESEEIRRAVVWKLVEDECEAATRLLATMAGRYRGDIGRIAEDELERRQPTGEVHQRRQPVRTHDSQAWARAFKAYWGQFDRLSPTELVTASAAMREIAACVLAPLRKKLSSSYPFERARALRAAQILGLTEQLEVLVHRLAYDPDPTVRSLAVSMLVELPDLQYQRVLHLAIEDADERVQANAVEALDALDQDEWIAGVKAKLTSPNGRVRANAVKSLLPRDVPEAGETLIDMLEGPSRGQKISGLWVVEQLMLRSMRGRVTRISREDSDGRVRHRAKRVLKVLSGSREVLSSPRRSSRPDTDLAHALQTQ
ncbi:MAG: HEAT repeat domain-containing protein [Phycisphaerales bacterium]|nr:MAG: HEAT repeat domain-containing protein [Phycisphaerales bacterium]